MKTQQQQTTAGKLTNLGVITSHRGVAWFKQLLALAFALVLASLAFAAAPALAAAPEAPETGKANPATITATTAILEDGVLNPHAALGEVAEYVYQFKVSVTECEGESEVTGAALGEKEEKVPPVELTNLQPNATYTFCLLERNLGGEYSLPSTLAHFTTKPAPPTLESESAPAPKEKEAKLEAVINPNNEKTKYFFEYATSKKTVEEGKGTPVLGAPPAAELESYGGQGVSVSTGAVLTPQTLYYYRVVAKNAAGEIKGKVESFLTGPPETPVEAKVKADSTTAVSVEVEGVLNPGKAGEPGSTYEFIYDETSSGGCGGGKAAPEPAGVAQGHAKERVSAKIEGLKPNAEYTFCLIASNAAGEKTSAVAEPVTFSTHAAAPVISGESAKNITETTATITAKVNPEGLETHVYVEYGKGQDTAPLDIGAVVGEQEVSFALKGLTADTAYPLHVVAFNDDGQFEGTEKNSFSTLAPPPPHPHGERPWWSLSSGSWPTNLHAGVAQDEVQKLTVSATKGIFILLHNGSLVAVVKFNATHEELQTDLEKENAYGAGNVEVPEGEGDETGSKPYKIIFKKELADQPVPLVEARDSITGGDLLSCEGATGTHCTANTSVLETTQGRADGTIVATAENTGDAWVDASVTPVVLEDTLPEHLEVVSVEGKISGATDGANGANGVACSPPEPHHVRCVLEGTFENGFGEIEPKALPPYQVMEMFITVKTVGVSAGEANVVDVSGGGAKPATLTEPIRVGASSPFGVADYKMVAEEEGGGVSTQAGVHPFQLTTTTVISTSEAARHFSEQEPAALTKDLTFQLPAGLIGNPTPLPQCIDALFTKDVPPIAANACPANTAIGETAITYNNPLSSGGSGFNQITVPVFNLEPRRGEPARFGFDLPYVKARVYLDTAVRSGGDYGVTVKVSNITQLAGFLSSKLTFWGVPADSAHDVSRGWQCGSVETRSSEMARRCSSGVTTPPPFLSLPTSCTGPMRTTLQADSWQEPHPSPAQSSEAPLLAEYEMGGLDGCNRLQFNPEVRVTPDGTEASKPTGLNVDVHVPQVSVLNAEGLAEANVKDITVALPEGVAVNPAGGDGLAACSEGLVGFTGFDPAHPEAATFTATPKPPFETLEPGLNTCENASKIGEVTIKSPLLPAGQFVKGFVYLATQNENPFGGLIALYLVAEEPISGTLIKLAGETRLTPSGQVIGVFRNSPQLAFEDAELHFFGEERAPLTSPAHCGAYTTNATFVPWSVEGAEAPRTSSSTFNITSGPNHSPCPGASLPFGPSLTGGATNLNAGFFSPLTGTFGREDGEQQIAQARFHLPPGLSGLLSSVKLCGEEQANAGTCGPESLIGETTVAAGVGAGPISVTGRIYITEKYHGAPFGLSVVAPVKAGPFDLERDTSNPAQDPACDCIVVRARIEVDPITTALTITTNSEGEGYAIPHLIDGIPVQLKRINFTTTRSGFQFNPTNCAPMAITGTVTSDEGASHNVEVPFQVTNCAVLRFNPKFTASTSGKTSRAKGASLTLKVTRLSGPGTGQANFALAKIELPKQLPSRLTTLQKACTAAQFDTNPAGCPAASDIGTVKVSTPILPVPLEGPAYFVSHGGEAFPSVIFVLQGYGITVDVVSTTFISKSGITSATIKTVPDAPFTSFELTFPEKQYSALAANGNLCNAKGALKMPTELIAQNGLEIKQSTKISVTGCPKAKKHNKKKPKHRKRGKKGKKKK